MASKTDRRGECARQPISFPSCVEDSEYTDQKAAQVASAPPGPLSDVKTKLMVIRQKVDRNRASWSRLECEWFSRRATLLAKRGRQAAGRSLQGRGRERHLRSNQSCGEGKYGGSELYRRSPRRKRQHANQQSSRTLREVNQSKNTVHSRGRRVIEDVKANMLQGIMQSATESESDDDDEESDEDEAKKPATSDKQKRSR